MDFSKHSARLCFAPCLAKYPVSWRQTGKSSAPMETGQDSEPVFAKATTSSNQILFYITTCLQLNQKPTQIQTFCFPDSSFISHSTKSWKHPVSGFPFHWTLMTNPLKPPTNPFRGISSPEGTLESAQGNLAWRNPNFEIPHRNEARSPELIGQSVGVLHS